MVELTVHAVRWCAHHGHPVLALRIRDSERYFVVAMAPEDATALASWTHAGASTGKERLLALVEAAIAALGGRPTGVWLHVGGDAVLRSSIRLEGPAGEVALPAHFADGIALAHRGRLPLRMEDAELARVPLGADALAAPSPVGAAPPGPFRDLIESLDFDGLGGIGPDGPRG